MNIPNPPNAAQFNAQEDDVFGRIAGRYDFLCDVFSCGFHRLWKRRVATLIAQAPWEKMLDAASGTGDIALRVLQQRTLSSGQEITISDISPSMRAIAQRRIPSSANNIAYKIFDAQHLQEIPTNSLDLFAISLGLKICDRNRVMHEAWRVLRPGGVFICLEASHLIWPWLQKTYLFYMELCMPLIGWIATGGDASAYRYLLKGIRAFPDAPALADELRATGFVDVYFKKLSLGIVAIHKARKST